MDRNAEMLAQQLLTWPSAERARLASLLLASVEPSESGVDAAWDAEVARRAAALDAGLVSSVPADAVFAELERRLRQ